MADKTKLKIGKIGLKTGKTDLKTRRPADLEWVFGKWSKLIVMQS